MSKRPPIPLSTGRDGTSQAGRHLPALDPRYVAIDERSTADLLAFVREFAKQIRFFAADSQADQPSSVSLGTPQGGAAGTWAAFLEHEDVSIADMVAYIANPEQFGSSARAQWLARPHFGLLLAFLELLGHARVQLNGLTGRHLDYYFREILRMLPEPAVADQAAVVFRLGARVDEVLLPAGTALLAGRDSAGVTRTYRTERELVVNRARVAALRSIYVHRRITGISDVRRDPDPPVAITFIHTMELALGQPRLGDPIPKFLEGAVLQTIDTAFITKLGPLLAFSRAQLFLEHHELRAMMKLVRRRAADAPEWARINSLLGIVNPANPRDFAGNLVQRFGVLDFAQDGLPQVANLDDLFDNRETPEVRAYIDARFVNIPAPTTFEKFEEALQIKRRIDAEWAEINRLLERAGQRQRGWLSWELDTANPTDFAGNLAKALPKPIPWPAGLPDITSYEARVRALEIHFSMSAERLARLVVLGTLVPTLVQDGPDWNRSWAEIDRILADAHREKTYAARRSELELVRANRNNLIGFDAVVAAVLDQVDMPPTWTDARDALAQYLDVGQLQILDQFRLQLTIPWTSQRFEWADVLQVLELAQRYVKSMPEPLARKVEWRNLYAYDDAKAVLDEADSSRWKTFGQRPPTARDDQPPTTELGWAVRSPLLALSQGTRRITLTLGLDRVGFSRPAVIAELGLAANATDAQLRDKLAAALVIQVSTAKGWIELPLPAINLDPVKLVTGAKLSDYWTLAGLVRLGDAEDRPALQLKLIADPTLPAIAAIEGSGEAWPTLRILLRQRWDEAAKEWTTAYSPFAAMQLQAVHLRVDVTGLVDVQLQQDDRPLDPRKPFEPFGSRPAVGSRFYLSHPELVRARLDLLHIDLNWMGLPANLRTHYTNYSLIAADQPLPFKAKLSLVERDVPVDLISASLFSENAEKTLTSPTQAIDLPNVRQSLQQTNPSFAYVRRDELEATDDLRAASRYLSFELTPSDFGHAVYPETAATKARELAIKLRTESPAASAYQVNAPYTPTLKSLTVNYRTSVELDLTLAFDADDRLLHVHPFGTCLLDRSAPSLLPRYDSAGELYIGIAELATPRKLALLLQLAEGTSDPDLDPAPIEWSYLDGDRFEPLELQLDSTRGLINSGIVELALPDSAASTRLPSGPNNLYWLRLAIPNNPASVCDSVDIRAQAVMVEFEDQGNAPDHYAQPLPVGSINRLQVPDVRIAKIEQPYTSFGGKPAEQAERFNTRVSERLRHKQRALAPWDYERLTLRFADIYKAKCLPGGALAGGALAGGALDDGESEPGRVDVIVIPNIRAKLPANAFAPRAPANLLADIQTYLSERAPVGAQIRVRNAQYVPVLVRLGVRFVAGQDEAYAKRRLNDELNRFLSPWAYDEGAELMIGGRIYAISIIDFVDRRDYVDYVADIKLARGRDGDHFDIVPPSEVDYHVATERPDQVLVAARQHVIDVIPELGYSQASFSGIGYMKIEFDFLVG